MRHGCVQLGVLLCLSTVFYLTVRLIVKCDGLNQKASHAIMIRRHEHKIPNFLQNKKDKQTSRHNNVNTYKKEGRRNNACN